MASASEKRAGSIRRSVTAFIPAAYDAFMDLAAIIGAPNIGMSLGRELAVQFANLGHKAKGAAGGILPLSQDD